jgi:hypothetical protein
MIWYTTFAGAWRLGLDLSLQLTAFYLPLALMVFFWPFWAVEILGFKLFIENTGKAIGQRQMSSIYPTKRPSGENLAVLIRFAWAHMMFWMPPVVTLRTVIFITLCQFARLSFSCSL